MITEALGKGKPVIAADVGAIPLQLRGCDTGYFYNTPRKMAQRVLNLLKNQRAADIMGRRDRKYEEEHFLLPDRITDYLAAIDMIVDGIGNKKRLLTA